MFPSRFSILAAVLLTLVPLSRAGAQGAAPQSRAEVLSRSGRFSDRANRRRAVGEMRRIENERRAAAWKRADAAGWPKRRILPRGTVRELTDLDGTRPVYFTTHNANAAISTGAAALRLAPYSVTGSGFTVGEWDAGSARTTHQEFGGRVTASDSAAADDHSTHVGGTIAASGVQAGAKGMASAARIDSYDWNNDASEMAARGASYPGEPGTIYLSNHSYGYLAGWSYTGLGWPQWEWWGTGTGSTGAEDDFGRYNTYSRDADSLAASLPYYLIVRSAGNDRTDNPGTGELVTLSPNGTSIVNYDPALHPLGDGVYKTGYDTIGFDSVAKNVLTVGAVSDAVSGAAREKANAAMTSFSSWGPTDDGRIKPDVVANGDHLYSPVSAGDTTYGSYSGTSMSAPNATGSALLLVSFFDKLFPSQAMRASTLKALLIHTADDLGTAGPDYQNGWGLVNVKAAADLIQTYRDHVGSRCLIEDRVTTSRTSVTQNFTWSGSGAMRATLCWTDPAGTATTTSESRTARLVNDLNLQVIGPGGSVHQSYVMPYVGDWTTAKLSAVATTGVNSTDNVEQVFIAAPPTAGVYQVQVTFSGTLSGGAQPFSLIISGAVTTDPVPAPSLSAVSPALASSGTVTLTLTGANVLLGATVKLTRSGQSDVTASGIEVQGDVVKARVNTDGLAAGSWNIVVTNPDGQSYTLTNALSIVSAFWQDQLETGASGWTHSAATSNDGWTLTTADSHSATHSFFAPGPAAKTDNLLVSPAIAIPSGASNLQLTFWHSHDFQSNSDGAVLEFSVDNGAFFDVTATGSGAAFASGGYNATISSGGPSSARNPLAGRSAWSGESSGWTQVAVNLTNAAKYAGHTLKIRWRLGTNNNTASTGWLVDDVALAGTIPPNVAPSIATAAAATPSPATGTTTALSVTATDDAGEAALTYTWSVNDDSTAPIMFSENGTNAAKNTVATFTKPGVFTFTVTVRDAAGVTATSSVNVLAVSTLSTVSATPTNATLAVGETQQFSATGRDQFGSALAILPVFTWATNGGGAVNANGLYTAGAMPGGPFLVTASAGGISGNANITITGQSFASWQAANFAADEISAGLADDTGNPDDDDLPNLLEYALGADPHTKTLTLAPAVIPDAASQERLTLTFTRPRALPGITYSVEVTSDLKTWDPVPTLEVTSTATTDTVIARDPVPSSDATRRFMRIRVARQPQ